MIKIDELIKFDNQEMSIVDGRISGFKPSISRIQLFSATSTPLHPTRPSIFSSNKLMKGKALGYTICRF